MKRRYALLPVLAAAHVAVALVALAGVRSEARAPVVAAMASYAVPAPAILPVLPPMTEVAVANDIPAPEIEIAVASVRSATATGAGGDCAVAEAVGNSLRTDPRAAAALAALPASARTVANALMLWDGRWTALAAPDAAAAVADLRAIVVASVQATPVACQVAPVTGPRLVIVSDTAGTVVLAFGSGTWTWAALAA